MTECKKNDHSAYLKYKREIMMIDMDIWKIADELEDTLSGESGCRYATRFLKHIHLVDGRVANLRLLLEIDDGDD